MKKKEFKKFRKNQCKLIRQILPVILFVSGVKLLLSKLVDIKEDFEYQEPIEGMMPDP